ncbi:MULTISPECIES: hypothetical protein [unclassified Mycobacteroides]|uniref:hypothetical protein n=1 Tax=unclassified Mycobacteroides TaxID=2618759 RepID=UPI00071554A8|nr:MULTISPECIES: hypothetical protein [unclassified Mycobacteroides]KRQ48026.1 hypothetical protein AOT92_00240 [Mycobacteroides sp. H101]
MSDPAIEAAQRAWGLLPERSYATREQVMNAAAREMAKSVQTVIEEWDSKGELHPQVNELLDQLAPLVYPSEELGL